MSEQGYSPPLDRRICVDCGKSKPRSEFGNIATGKPAKCKACKTEANTAYQRKRRTENPALIRSNNLWRLYKITEQEYDDLRHRQEYRCAICGRHEDDLDTSKDGGRPRQDGTMLTRFALHVDHCHDRDAVRGLLCRSCNYAIASFRDDAGAMRRAAAYVEREPLLPIDRNRVRPV